MTKHKSKAYKQDSDSDSDGSASPVMVKCFCKRNAIRLVSRTEKNPNRPFYTCIKKDCKFFKWEDEMEEKDTEHRTSGVTKQQKTKQRGAKGKSARGGSSASAADDDAEDTESTVTISKADAKSIVDGIIRECEQRASEDYLDDPTAGDMGLLGPCFDCNMYYCDGDSLLVDGEDRLGICEDCSRRAYIQDSDAKSSFKLSDEEIALLPYKEGSKSKLSRKFVRQYVAKRQLRAKNQPNTTSTAPASS